MTAPLTEREEALVVAFEWLANSFHEAHHMITVDANGNNIRVPDAFRRPVAECGSAFCQYARKVVVRAREVKADGSD